MKNDQSRSDHPRVISTADPRVDLVAQFEGRKKALLSGEHYTTEPLSKDHRDDILRWIYDLDLAIAALRLQQEFSIELCEQLKYVAKSCPCGARSESPRTHPHVAGCPIEKVIREDRNA